MKISAKYVKGCTFGRPKSVRLLYLSKTALPKALSVIVVLLGLFSLYSCNQASSAQKISLPPEQVQSSDKSNTSHFDKVKYSSPLSASNTSKKSSSLKCPVCGRKKNAKDDLCARCTDELANTCYKCGDHELGLNGKLCSDCRKIYCAICNGRKKDTMDDLCAKCHNRIEEQGSKIYSKR